MNWNEFKLFIKNYCKTNNYKMGCCGSKKLKKNAEPLPNPEPVEEHVNTSSQVEEFASGSRIRELVTHRQVRRLTKNRIQKCFWHRHRHPYHQLILAYLKTREVVLRVHSNNQLLICLVLLLFWLKLWLFSKFVFSHNKTLLKLNDCLHLFLNINFSNEMISMSSKLLFKYKFIDMFFFANICADCQLFINK
jgi:hypothetical protein